MIGVVILNYNGASLTGDLTDKIRKYQSIGKIVIVDNKSTDDSFTALKKRFIDDEKVKVILSESNSGYSSGNNIGLKWLVAEGKYNTAFVCNPDVLFEESFIIQLDKGLKQNPDYGLLTGIMLDSDGTFTKNQYWSLPNFREDFFRGFFIFNFLIKKNNKGLIKSDNILECVPAGSAEAVNLEYMKEVGYFDESVFLFYEENILAKKLKESKYKTGILLSCEYYHYHSQIINSTVSIMNKYKLFQRSMYYYQVKYNKINSIQKILLKASMVIGKGLFFFKNCRLGGKR